MRQHFQTRLLFAARRHPAWLKAVIIALVAIAVGIPAASSDPLGDWGSFGIAEPARFSHPQGVASDGYSVYVSDFGNKRVQKFDMFGRYVDSWGSSGTGPGHFHHPAGIAAHDGHVYVADRDLHRIQKFTHNGTFVLEWGSRGSAEGQFLLPTDIALYDGTIYVTDTGNQRVQAFDVNGTFQSSIGSSGLGEADLLTPLGIDVDPAGDIYVADRGNSKIAKFYPNGTLAASFPFHYYGYEFRPAAVAIDRDSMIYVVNSATGKIMRLAQDGDLLVDIFEQRGPYGITVESADIAIGPSGQLLATDALTHSLKSLRTPHYAEPEDIPPAELTEKEVAVYLDRTRPEITPPGPVLADAVDHRTEVDIGTAEATDEGGIRSVSSTAPDGFKPGRTTVVWVAYDLAGYKSTAEQVVTVNVCGMDAGLYNIIVGTDGNDLLEGTPANDAIFGLGGDDYITGLGGDDCIFGGGGDDIIAGGDGSDTVRGNGGNDVIKGGPGDDRLLAGGGYDVADGGDGTDSCSGGSSEDVLVGCE